MDTVDHSIAQIIDIVKVNNHFYTYGFGNAADSSRHTLFIIKSDSNGNIIDSTYIFEDQNWLSNWPHIQFRPKISVTDNDRLSLISVNINTFENEVFCIDTNLNKLWHSTIPLFSYNTGEKVKSIIFNGGYYYIALRASNKNGSTESTKLIKLDQFGNIVNSKVISEVEGVWDLKFNKDKTELLLTGISTNNLVKHKNYLLKLDLDFEVISTINIQTDNNYDFGHYITLIDNSSDYITTSYDILPCPPYNHETSLYLGYALNITRRDTNMNVLWKISLFPPTSPNNGFSAIVPSQDGYYYAFGQFVSFMEDKLNLFHDEDSLPIMNSFLTKFTADGQLIGQRLDTFDYYEPANWTWTQAGGIVALEDGGVMLNGICERYTPYTRNGWMMRLDANGCLLPGDCATSSVFNHPRRENLDFEFYPNPSTGIFTLQIPEVANVTYDVSVSNSFGKVIYKNRSIKSGSILNIDLIKELPGVYYVTMNSTSGIKGIKKLIIVK